MTALPTCTRTVVLVAALMTCTSLLLEAQVVQTTGSGSAVTRVDASASFEDQAALTANPYVENGLSFTRTNLSFDNNSCGFAGCKPPFTYFPGNYMYGVGRAPTGYFSMFAPVGQLFSGLEFMVGTGFGGPVANVMFSAFVSGVPVGSGSTDLPLGTVIGFSSVTGFNELRYTDNGQNGLNAPAFDEVRAQLVGAAVTTTPEPASLVLLATGLAGVFGAARRRRTIARV